MFSCLEQLIALRVCLLFVSKLKMFLRLTLKGAFLFYLNKTEYKPCPFDALA